MNDYILIPHISPEEIIKKAIGGNLYDNDDEDDLLQIEGSNLECIKRFQSLINIDIHKITHMGISKSLNYVHLYDNEGDTHKIKYDKDDMISIIYNLIDGQCRIDDFEGNPLNYLYSPKPARILSNQYYENYNKNIDKIIEYRESISGIFSINSESARRWIKSQLTERRRKAAKLLVKNTHYITLNVLFEDIRNCVVSIYKALDLNRDIYMYTGDKKSSYYFVGMIALYFIKLLKYKEPICIPNIRPNIQIMMFDDCMYTGGQFGLILSYSQRENSIIHVGLSCICIEAINKIENLRQDDKSIKIFTYQQRLFDLLDNLSMKEFFDLTYYFSPYLYGNTRESLYFDHKIADAVSTFMKILNFGPILPTKLNYDRDQLEDSLVFDTDEINGIMTKEEFDSYYNEMLEEEKTIKENVVELKCIPFINNCDKIDRSMIENLPYAAFQSRVDQYSGDGRKIYSQYSHILKIIDNKENRCPSSFYKKLF